MDQFYEVRKKNKKFTPVCNLKSDRVVYGQKIANRFVLLEVFKLGDRHRLWRALDEILNSPVVIKDMWVSDQNQGSHLFDIERELYICQTLLHPNVIQVYGFVQAPQMDGLLIEYVDGKNLLELKGNEPARNLDELRQVTTELCHALDYIHGKGIIHRDIKPSNMMIDKHGILKIIDWETAIRVGETYEHQEIIRGTLNYMSPEQIEGKAASVTEDIYGVGATLFRLCTGEVLFSSGAIFSQIRCVVPPTVNELRKQTGMRPIPRDWNDTIAACLRKNPVDRPQSMQEIATRLGLKDQRVRTTKRWKDTCYQVVSNIFSVGRRKQYVINMCEEKSTTYLNEEPTVRVDQEATVRFIEEPTVRLVRVPDEGLAS